MRFLILSDIHANSTALDASLAAAEGRYERVLCLGDLVDYGPDPNEVTDRVKALDPVIIRGNHELRGFQSRGENRGEMDARAASARNARVHLAIAARPCVR
jgi:predicted phosphodiesterase